MLLMALFTPANFYVNYKLMCAPVIYQVNYISDMSSTLLLRI